MLMDVLTEELKAEITRRTRSVGTGFVKLSDACSATARHATVEELASQLLARSGPAKLDLSTLKVHWSELLGVVYAEVKWL